MGERLNGGMLIAAAGGALLLVSLFLEWYEPDLSAWDTFELADLVLATTAIAAIAGVLRLAALDRAHAEPIQRRALLFLGVGALIITVAGVIQPPPAALESSPRPGAWLGLAGAALIAGGALLATSRISILVSFDRREPVTPPGGSDVVPPPAGTEPAPPDTETSSIPAHRD